MAKRLPPALEAAVRNHEVTAARWRAHRKVCHPCQQAEAHGRPRAACEEGYRLWQADTRTGRHEALLRAQADAGADLQLALL